ncbi:MAG: hypothetical protein J7J72_11240 [Bacteroidales bacterium]|nr:hypothetical protein [Bacteroidales bacterium]
MKKIGLSIIIFFSISIMGYSQSKIFTPEGKPFMKVFTNFHSSFSDGKSNSAFEIKRAYLGYEYAFSKNFSAKANFDIDNPGTGKLQMTVYIKNAYLKYKLDNFTAKFGMIGTKSFSVQESAWGYRYIEKSFQDAYKFNASADLGASVSYKFNDIISADAIIANGEGYKNLQADSTFRTGFGLTFNPIKRLTARVYYDFSTKINTQSSIIAFLGYKANNYSIGAEYNKLSNVGFYDGREMSGSSFYARVKASKKLSIFARYDQLLSNKLAGASDSWNIAKDGQLFIAGIEYAPVKGVKLAPNFKGWNPTDTSKTFVSTFFLNCEIKF